MRIESCYVGDLLSDILAHARKNSMVITMQNQRNTLAVAVANQISLLVLTLCENPQEGLVELAKQHHISLVSTTKDSYSFLKSLEAWI